MVLPRRSERTGGASEQQLRGQVTRNSLTCVTAF